MMQDERRWGPRPSVFGIGGVAGALCLLWLLLVDRSQDRAIAGFVLAVVIIGLLIALRMRTRLVASFDGLQVGTLAGRVQIPWTAVHRLELVARSRRGIRSSVLEVDADLPGNDDSLLVFGRIELGADPGDVADALIAMRSS